KYSEYLVTTTASMIEFHHSDKNTRNSENSSTMYQIAACKNLHENYIQLNDILFNKPLYDYINIQPYLSINIIKRY
ncbi:19790_t:CDS:1, partial [Funneliformis geosporum]